MKKIVSLQTDMRKIAVLTISLMVMLMASCGQKKKDAAYYEMMVDSIRKAEQVKELRRQAGITDGDPLEEFFLKLSLRTLPLHRSQEEVLTKYEQFSEFQYKVCLTPELSTQLLAMGENVEVLEPQELREEMKKRLEECLTRYK